MLEKHDTDNLLPDLSTDSSSDLDGYSNTSSSNIGSSSSSDASSSPLSSSNSSNSSVGIGDYGERSGYESSENISFASGSDTLEQVVDTTSFALGDNADEEERTGRKKSQDIALSSSSSGISNSNSSSGDNRNNSSSRNSSSSIPSIVLLLLFLLFFKNDVQMLNAVSLPYFTPYTKKKKALPPTMHQLLMPR